MHVILEKQYKVNYIHTIHTKIKERAQSVKTKMEKYRSK